MLPFRYLAATGPGNLALVTAVVGLGIAPTLIGGFGLVEAIVDSASLTEGLTWIGTGLSVGYGAGASVVGRIADSRGAHDAFWLPIGCALVAAVFAALPVVRIGSGERRTGAPVGCRQRVRGLSGACLP